MSRFSQQGRSKLRYQAAAACAVGGIFMLFLALRFHTKDYLKLAQIDQRPGPAYSRLWFDNRDVLAGATQQGTRLTVDRWSGGGSSVETWSADLATPGTRWAIAPDFSRIAWIAGSKLYWQALEHGPHIEAKNAAGSASLPVGPVVLALSVLSDRSAAIVLSDATIRRWDAAGNALPDWRSALASADQAVAEEDYLAISSIPQRQILLYRFREKEGWKLQEQTSAPDPPFQLILPARGAMATLSAEGLQIGGKIRNSPGAVRSVVRHLDDVIATGDFDQVFVLSGQDEEQERYSLAQAAPGSLVAISSTQLAVSGPQGTTLSSLLTENRLTTTGRRMSTACGILFLATVVLACWILIFDGIRLFIGVWFKQDLRKTPNPRQFPNPPGELITACATGECALWAGAGLSAQCGLPVRASFIASILQAASIEGMVSAVVHQKLAALHRKGDAEGALNGLIESAHRSDLISYFRSILYRIVVPSRCHELLAQVSFSSAVTTNYDFLLQQAGGLWAAAPATLKSAEPSGFLDRAGFPDRATLIKLYGDLDQHETLLLSRAEFQAALNSSPERDGIRGILRDHPVLFVGCSLDGLLADLKALGAAETPQARHFALTGVSGNSWQGPAAELKRRYGIEVLACDVDAVQKALVEFLEKLLRAVEQVRKESIPAARVSSASR